MVSLVCMVLGLLLTEVSADDNTAFSDDFMFGVATSAYQIEGGWNKDGKGESNWDYYLHKHPDFIDDKSNGDTACDSYHQLDQDIKILSELKVTHYRFSISWSRIFPNGMTNKRNDAGVNYYSQLIDKLKQNNIEPFVTLFHWDTPQFLEEMGGWANSDIINIYKAYASSCFKLFGDKVKYWATFNEPKQICSYGYGKGTLIPAVKSAGIGEYLCVYNIIRAHAATWKVYNEIYRTNQKGKIGIMLDSDWWETKDNSDNGATIERMLQFTIGMYANPLINGDYPDDVKNAILTRSTKQGFPKSRLPQFTDEEKNNIKGTIDFLGINHYASHYVESTRSSDATGMGYEADSEVTVLTEIDSAGIGKLLNWIYLSYKIPIFITGNGYAVNSASESTDNDELRRTYLKTYLSDVKTFIDGSEANVMGYTVWSLLDNFEWISGYKKKFGLYRVDFEHSRRTRTAKKSASFYSQLIKTKCLGDCSTTTTSITTSTLTTVTPTSSSTSTSPKTTTTSSSTSTSPETTPTSSSTSTSPETTPTSSSTSTSLKTTPTSSSTSTSSETTPTTTTISTSSTTTPTTTTTSTSNITANVS